MAAAKGKPPVPVVPNEPDESKADSDRFDPKEPGFVSGHVAYRRDGLRTANTASYTELGIDDGIGKDPISVPCWHAHLAELVELHDPQVGDANSLRCFGRRASGFGYSFALRVEKAS